MILISLLFKHSPNVHDIKFFKFIPFSILFLPLPCLQCSWRIIMKWGHSCTMNGSNSQNKTKTTKKWKKSHQTKNPFGRSKKNKKKNQQKLGASCRMNKTLFLSIKTFESKTITIWNDVWPFFFFFFPS